MPLHETYIYPKFFCPAWFVSSPTSSEERGYEHHVESCIAKCSEWDTENGAELCNFSGHTNSVVCAVYSLDERRIISASDDGTIRIWNSDTGQTSYIPEIDQELSSLSLSDGWIKSAKGELLLWVPPEYRIAIRDMCEMCIPADAPNRPVKLDWSKLVRGMNRTNILMKD